MLRVAVVDDEINTLKYIKKIVEREFVSNGIECEYFLFVSALQFVKEQNINNFDIVFLDIMIPEFSGFQAARQIRDSNCQTRIIFITSNEESVYESFDFQPFNFVKKDCNDIFESRMKYIIKNLIHHLKQNNTIIFKLSLSEEKKMEICNIIAIKSDGNYLEVYWQPLKTSFDKNQLCTAFAASSPLGVRQHAFEDSPCNCRTYLIFA